jgi:hypothetical protein
MLRRFVFLSVGALALVVVLGAPGQLHARPMRGGMMPRMVSPGFRSSTMPGMQRRFDPRFNRGFNPRFNRGFGPRFNRGFNRGFSDPRLSPGFRPMFVHPF